MSRNSSPHASEVQSLELHQLLPLLLQRSLKFWIASQTYRGAPMTWASCIRWKKVGWLAFEILSCAVVEEAVVDVQSDLRPNDAEADVDFLKAHSWRCLRRKIERNFFFLFRFKIRSWTKNSLCWNLFLSKTLGWQQKKKLFFCSWNFPQFLYLRSSASGWPEPGQPTRATKTGFECLLRISQARKLYCFWFFFTACVPKFAFF